MSAHDRIRESPTGEPATITDLGDTTVGTLFDVQRFCVHDGPGLRTTVFLKGCPLRCVWCDNPESQQAEPELTVFAGNCISCGQFAPRCPALWEVSGGAAASAMVAAELEKRARVCPTVSVRWIGRRATAASVMAAVRRDLPFFGEDGGLTLSGGEPLMQPEFAMSLLRMASAEGINTAIETCGHVPWQSLEDCLPFVNTVLFDLKHMDPVTHWRHTGVDNELILGNLRRLARSRAPVIVRVPLIPGFNASLEDIQSLARFVAGLELATGRLDLLPYHALGRPKYEALGRRYRWADCSPLSEQQIHQLAEAARACGLSVTVGG